MVMLYDIMQGLTKICKNETASDVELPRAFHKSCQPGTSGPLLRLECSKLLSRGAVCPMIRALGPSKHSEAKTILVDDPEQTYLSNGIPVEHGKVVVYVQVISAMRSHMYFTSCLHVPSSQAGRTGTGTLIFIFPSLSWQRASGCKVHSQSGPQSSFWPPHRTNSFLCPLSIQH